jgi:formylmethanofuran dehydrogenase subunit A
MSKDYRKIRKAFEKAIYTIKNGQIVVNKGNVIRSFAGRTYWTDLVTKNSKEVSEDLKRKFREYWTVEYDNYVVPEEYISKTAPVSIYTEI